MDEVEYYQLQVNTEIHKPIHYRIGEYWALKHFFQHVPKSSKILDVGCGIGDAVGILNKAGFHDVVGFDMNPDKITVGKSLGYNVRLGSVLDMPYEYHFDIIWCSHAFEHFINPRESIHKMLGALMREGRIFMILPYPDLHPAPAHVASKEIGLDIDDVGRTVKTWFRNRGASVNWFGGEDYREPELWLELGKQ